MTRRNPPTTPDVSERMKGVRTSRTIAERKVERVLRQEKIRFRRNVRGLPGKPDFLLVDHEIAVFVDGCFWHGCPKCFAGTKTNREWWEEKIRENRRRDRRIDAALRRMGLRTLHLWGHDDAERCTKRIRSAVGSQTNKA